MRLIRIAFCLLWLSLKFIPGATGQGLPPGWDFTITPLFHPFAIPLSAHPSLFGDSLMAGDHIGVFFTRNDSLICAGASAWVGNENVAVVAFGDDNMTTLKDGFHINETIHWKIYSWIVEEEFSASATYDSAMTDYDGKFHPGGLSALTGLHHGEALQLSAEASPDTSCIGNTVQLTALASGGSESYSFSWFSLPEGFSSGKQNPSVNPLQTTSYIVIVEDGYHSLTDTTTVTVVQLPQVFAGNDTLICENGLVSLQGAASDFQRVIWLTDGDGQFSDSAGLITSYLPGSSDLEDRWIKLTLKAWALQPCLDSVIDFLYLSICPLPMTDAGNDEAICAGEHFQTSGYAEHYTMIEWSSQGDGSFDNPNYLEANYFPGEGDLQSGEISLILSGYPPLPCTMTISDTMMLTIHPLPSVNAGVDHWISYGASTQLNGTVSGGSGEYLYWWEPAVFLENPEAEDPLTLNLYQSTIFVLTGTDGQTSCSELDTAIVTVTGGPLAVTATAHPDTICTGSLSQLKALPGGGSGNYAFAWTSDPPGFTSSEQNPTVIPGQSTTYTVTVNGGFNTAGDQAAVQVTSPPEADAGEDETIPCGTSTTLQGAAAGGTGEYSFYWSPAQFLVDPLAEDPVTFDLTQPVEFTLTVTDLLTQCQDQDSVNVFVAGGPLQVNVTATPEEVCAGEPSQLNALASGGSGTYTYAWTSDPPGFFSGQADPVVIPEITKDYFVQVFDGFTTASGYTTVEVFPVPVVDIRTYPGDTVCAGEAIRLDASIPGGIQYLWTPGGQTEPVIEVDSAGTGFGSVTYTVYVRALDGCTGVDSVEVTFFDCVGIPESKGKVPGMIVYPNPAEDWITVQLYHAGFTFDGGPVDTYHLVIADTMGRMLLLAKLSIREHTHSLSLGSLPPGIYILLLKRDDSVLSAEKMVVK